MKRYLFLLFFSLLFAEEFDEIAFYEKAASFHPFGINSTTLQVDRTHFYTPGFEDKTLSYFQSDAAFAFTMPCTECGGFMLGANWVGTDVAMEDNPAFTETFFNYIGFSIGGFSSSYDNWLWTLNITVNIDMAQINLADYALYQGVLWGKYNYTCFEFDIGMIVEIGLDKEKIWPIIGFGYNFTDYSRLKIIYPVDIRYELDIGRVTLASSIRFLRNRHRTSPDNPIPMAIFEYMTSGIEFDATLKLFKTLELQGFVGTTFDGSLKISDRHDNNSTYYKFRGSFYAGGCLQAAF